MDCNTARMLLDFGRPTASELDAVEVEALEAHLAHCLDCETAVRAERRVDRKIARAMQQVSAPIGLLQRINSRLETEGGVSDRRWFVRRAQLAAAAAVLLLSGWGAAAWFNRPVRVDLDKVVAHERELLVSPPGKPELQNIFRQLGVDAELPDNLNYSLLAYHGVTEFQGRRVPQLIFLRQGSQARAQVRVLSASRFDLGTLPAGFRTPDGGYEKVELWKEGDHPQSAQLVVYTGDNAEWVKKEPQGRTDDDAN